MTKRKATGVTLTPDHIKAAAADGQELFEQFCAREELLEKRRQAFEAFVREDGLDHEWNAERNCYKVFACHFAWRAFNNALDVSGFDAAADLVASVAGIISLSREATHGRHGFYELRIGHGVADSFIEAAATASKVRP